MPRVKRGTQVRKKRKNLFARTKGYKHGRKNLVRLAHQALLRAMHNSFKDRRTKKRNFRQLWIIRINAALRQHGLTYSKFIPMLKENGIELDRKILSALAKDYPAEFEKIVKRVNK